MSTFNSHPSIPGPWLPFISPRLVHLIMFKTPFACASLRYLHDTYGNIVALVHGDASIVFVFGSTLNFYVLTHPKLFLTEWAELSLLQEELQGTALGRLMIHRFKLNGEHYQNERRIMQNFFHKQQVVHYYNNAVFATKQTLNHWREQSRVDIYQQMRHLVHRIRMNVFLGNANEADFRPIGALLAQTIPILPHRAGNARVNLPGSSYYQALRLSEKLEGALHDFIVQKRNDPGLDPTGMLAILMNLQYENGERLSDEELVGHMFNLFDAGYENSVTALTWAIFLLSQHPQVCLDLLEELNGTFHDSFPTQEQLACLPLLDGIVKESLRLFSPFIVNLRITSTSCNLGGFSLPKGAMVFYSPLITHRSPALYEEPHRFKPERWTNLEHSPYEYLPFGAGQRRCIGTEFVIQEMKVVLALVFKRYRLMTVPHSKIVPDSSMKPLYGIPMYLFPQDRQFQRVPVRGTINQLVDLTGA
ncbi:MAG TPA: cytochrome P450 [Ktedonobacteraceae bacterium]